MLKTTSVFFVLVGLFFFPLALLNCSMQFSEEVQQVSEEEEKRRVREALLKKIREKYLKEQQQWVDSVFAKLSLEERIGQLYMVAAYSNKDEQHYQEIERLVKEQGIGGLIFFQGGPLRQAILTNRYQKAAKVPLLIGIDGEWGL
ncbi:MAG: hypothetical protein NZ521_03840, partial [Flammeovirgaceae bacterium]|nr:hypothetical protein [Flammeovirgaceae bacterium]MDW8287324.1 hypothetical protein [Flammeovirgaceae bacterium]